MGQRGVGDERLAPIQHVLIAPALGARLQGAGIGPGAGFRKRERPQPLAGGHLGQIALLLLRRSEAHDADAPDPGVHADEARQPPRAAAELLVDERLLEHRQPQAAMLRRDAQSEQPQRPRSIEQRRRQLVGAVDLLPAAIGLLLDKRAHRLLQQCIVGSQAEVHAGGLLGAAVYMMDGCGCKVGVALVTLRGPAGHAGRNPPPRFGRRTAG